MLNESARYPSEGACGIYLHIFRHDEKNKGVSKPGLRTGDYEVRLTNQGRKNSKEYGTRKNIDYRNSVGYHSPRNRTKETLYHRLNLPKVGIQTTLEEVEDIVDSHIKYGKKTKIDDRLNFYLGEDMKTDSDILYNKEAYKYFSEKKYIDFIINFSDELFVKCGDMRLTSYSKGAGDIAEIIQKYLKVHRNRSKISQKKAIETKELHRLFATHAGVGELFLIKVIQKTYGDLYLSEFLDVYNLHNGFDYSEGFDVVIKENEMKLLFKSEEVSITDELLSDIINEREELYLAAGIK